MNEAADPTEFWLHDVHVLVPERRIGAPGDYVKVEPKVMAVLTCLARRSGEVVPRSELFDLVWPRTVVSDEVLSRCVYRLRKALGDNPEQPMFIETVPKVGYRMLATPVLELAPDGYANPEPGQTPAVVSGTRPSWMRPSWWAVGLVFVGVSVGAFVWRDPVPAAPPSVLMMPITVDDDDGSLAMLAMALNDSLRNAVASYAEPDVALSWAAARQGASSPLSTSNADYAFHGTLLPNPGENRALLHLYIDSRSGAETVTSPLNVFEVPHIGAEPDTALAHRDAVIQRILHYLTIELPYVHLNLSDLEIEAFRLLMYADWELYSGRDCGIGAQSLLERAVELNPASARAWAQLGEAYWTQVWDCGRGEGHVARALAALDQALAVDPEHITAHYQRAIIMAQTGDVEQAYEMLHARVGGSQPIPPSVSGPSVGEALRSPEPASESIYMLYARMDVLVHAGFLHEASAVLAQIEARDPLAMSAEMVDLPFSLWHAGQYAQFLARSPTKPVTFMYYYRAFARALLGDRVRTLELLERQRALEPSSVFADYGAALHAYLDGDPEAVVAVIRNVEARRSGSAPVDGATAFREARLLALAGADDLAADRVRQAVDRGFFCPVCFETTGFERLRGRPDFEASREESRRRHLAFAERFDLAAELPGNQGAVDPPSAPLLD